MKIEFQSLKIKNVNVQFDVLSTMLHKTKIIFLPTNYLSNQNIKIFITLYLSLRNNSPHFLFAIQPCLKQFIHKLDNN